MKSLVLLARLLLSSNLELIKFGGRSLKLENLENLGVERVFVALLLLLVLGLELGLLLGDCVLDLLPNIRL
jgi:hypothetical protein